MSPRAAFCRKVWTDMVALYGAPGVGDLCLALQDAFDADVPLLLFLVLADAAGEGLDAAGRATLHAAAADWRALAVVPLRGLRRALKGRTTSPAEEAFRRMVKAAELEAERIEVERLAAIFGPLSGPVGLAAPYLADLGAPTARAEAALVDLRRAAAPRPA
ncbi:TIGR02444 family protein [Prosthecomicrobium sp. N25]|uniref:TIGR02444 family protein n=1 Tax=Prosthecomicrobium sp. N25 TaxID=3129254 RepID=UPI003077E472